MRCRVPLDAHGRGRNQSTLTPHTSKTWGHSQEPFLAGFCATRRVLVPVGVYTPPAWYCMALTSQLASPSSSDFPPLYIAQWTVSRHPNIVEDAVPLNMFLGYVHGVFIFFYEEVSGVGRLTKEWEGWIAPACPRSALDQTPS